ncbi:DUF952 domain-containing protein [uncultured Brevundimonas sp.]|uniref:DUF952 domain-containing protein n=1 Tax=uncultured Brevundimonas sp. TaxID=213418 RepID=UPI0030EB1DCC|tara:strand:- start:64145 stop:64504 length:360 start_codon:yes stop_codon:yes gene_type:complete
MSAPPTIAFKLIDRDEWSGALAEGRYHGSAVDLADGYIHMSSAEQLAETARRHYAGRRDLVLLTVELEALDEALVWEASRGGDLFPHLYGSLPIGTVSRARDLIVDDDGALYFDDGGTV